MRGKRREGLSTKVMEETEKQVEKNEVNLGLDVGDCMKPKSFKKDMIIEVKW